MYKSDNEQNKMSGINKYNHFGLREDWIAALIDLGDNFFPWHESHPLGNKMVQSASAWFQQAMLIEPKTRKMTVLSKVFEERGSERRWLGTDMDSFGKQCNSCEMVCYRNRY